MQPMQPPLLANELNPDVILAAQIVLGLFVLIITLLAFPRLLTDNNAMLIPTIFQQVDLVLELISKVVGTLDRIVVLLLRLIRDLPQIFSMTHDGFQQVVSVLELISEAVGTLVSIVVQLQRLITDLRQIISMAHDGFQQVVSVLELIGDVVGSLVNFVVLLLRLIRICRRVWSIWTADINHGQNDIPLTDAEGDAANSQNDVIVNEELKI